MRRRDGRRAAADGRAGARLSGLQGGVVRGRRAARRALPRRAVRRAGPRPVDGAAAAARRVHAGEADGRLPRGRRRGQPRRTGAPGGPRLGVGPVAGNSSPSRAPRAASRPSPRCRGPRSTTSATGSNGTRSGPRPVRPPSSSARAPSPGTCTCCTPRCCRSWPGAVPSAGAGRGSWSGWRRCPRATTRRRRCAPTPHTAPGCTATTYGRACAGPVTTPTRTRRCSS